MLFNVTALFRHLNKDQSNIIDLRQVRGEGIRAARTGVSVGHSPYGRRSEEHVAFVNAYNEEMKKMKEEE